MASEWPWVKLGDVVINFDSQRVPLSAREREKRRGRFPYYGATGVMDHIDDYLFEGMHLLVAEDGSVETDRGIPFLQLVGGRFWVNNHAHVIKGETDIDTRYLFYALSTIQIRPFMTGSVQAKLSQGNLNRITIPYPSHSERHAIAHILGTLDDKIELNRRMNQTLEAMAQALFKSWFMDFEPFRDKGMEDSPLGQIPKGWNTDKLSKLCSTQYGYTASANDEPVGPHLLRVTDINKQDWIEWTSVPYCQIEERDKPKYALDVGDVVVARMADPGKSAIIEQPVDAVFASYLVRLKTASLAHTYYVYGFLKSRAYAEYAEGAMGGSSVQKSMNARVIVDTDLVIPPRQTLESFLDYILPLRKRLVANVEQSASLATIRDTLLPKLLSGDIRVKDAEKFVEEAI